MKPNGTRGDSAPLPEADRYRVAALVHPRSLVRVAFIGVVLIAIAACFAWAGGWFAHGRLDRAQILDAFEAANGVHAGFRRNHAKGVCLAGVFDSNGAGAQYSEAQIFERGRVPVFGRFALAGGVPTMPDGPGAVRSMALNFTLPDGETWRTGMNDIPVFPVKDPQGFYDQLVAMRPDAKTGAPDPDHVNAFLSAHPEAARAQSIIRAHAFSSGFADATYNSLDAFLLVDRDGESTPVRWSMVPVDAFEAEPSHPPDDKNYLFDALITRIARAPAQWHLVLTLGEPGDPTADATVAWPAGRRRVDVGTLTVTRIDTEAAGNCRDINFDPLVLPSGIEPSDDPLLSARSATYALSFTRRAREAKTPAAVQVEQGS